MPSAAAEVEPPPSPRSLEAIALSHRRKDDWGRAARDANQRLISADPTNFGAWVRKARCERELEDFDEAEHSYREALALTAGDESRRKSVERALLDLIPLRRAKAQRGATEADLRRQIAASSSPRQLVHMAVRLRDQGRLDLAVEAHERSLQLADSARTRAICVASYAATKRRLGHWKSAAVDCASLLEGDPDPVGNLEAYTCLTAALGDAEWLEDAVALLDAVLRFTPRDYQVATTARSIYGRFASAEGAGEWHAGQRELDHRWRAPREHADDRELERLSEMMRDLLAKLTR